MANSTDSAPVDFHFIFTMMMLSLFIAVAFFGNVLVLVVFAYTKELQTIMNYFLISLAFADLLTAIFPLPLWMAVKVNNNRWPFSYALQKAWQCVDLTFCTSSIWNLCAISIDRCLAIASPFVHRAMLTPFRMKCAVAAVWLYSVSVCVLITDYVTWSRRGLLISCLSFYIPTVVIIVAYFTIYISELKARFELQGHVLDIPLRHRCKQDLKMAKYMILLIVSFLICWVGHFVLSTYFAFGGSMTDPFLSDLIKAMTYLNSCLNPFLYGYVSPKFRAAVVGILRRHGRRLGNSGLGFSQTSPIRPSSQRTSLTKLDEKPPRSLKETSV